MNETIKACPRRSEVMAEHPAWAVVEDAGFALEGVPSLIRWCGSEHYFASNGQPVWLCGGEKHVPLAELDKLLSEGDKNGE